MVRSSLRTSSVTADGSNATPGTGSRPDLTLDLTREQFVRGERFGEPAVEEPILTPRNPERFATLRARVRAQLELD